MVSIQGVVLRRVKVQGGVDVAFDAVPDGSTVVHCNDVRLDQGQAPDVGADLCWELWEAAPSRRWMD